MWLYKVFLYIVLPPHSESHPTAGRVDHPLNLVAYVHVCLSFHFILFFIHLVLFIEFIYFSLFWFMFSLLGTDYCNSY